MCVCVCVCVCVRACVRVCVCVRDWLHGVVKWVNITIQTYAIFPGKAIFQEPLNGNK